MLVVELLMHIPFVGKVISQNVHH